MFNRHHAHSDRIRHTAKGLGVLAVAAGVAALTTGTAAAAGNSSTGSSTDALEQVAPLVQPSVVYETITWTGYVYDTHNHQYIGPNKPYSVVMQCTGFVVNPDGWIGTAGHCVDPSEGKDIIRQAAAEWAVAHHYYTDTTLTVDQILAFDDFRVDSLSNDTSHPVTRNSVARAVSVSWSASVSGVAIIKNKPVRVVAFQHPELGDAALLKADETDLNAIPLADTSTGTVAINSDITAIGYPAIIDSYTDPDLTPTFDNGTVSSIKTIGDDLLSVYQVNAALSGGMSGGPAVNDDGQVVGVNSSHFEGEPFNYVVPAERIHELLASAGVTNTLSATTLTYRAGIEAYFAGDRATALQDLDTVVKAQPLNSVAADYLTKAKALPEPTTPGQGGPALGLIAGAAAAALLLAGLIAGLLYRRTRRTNGPAAAFVRSGAGPRDAMPGAGAPVAAPSGQHGGYFGPLADGRIEAAAAAPTFASAADPAQRTTAPVSSSMPVAEQPVGFAPGRRSPAPRPRVDTTSTPVGAASEHTTATATVRMAAPSAASYAFCQQCGSAAEPGFRFCGGCGHHL